MSGTSQPPLLVTCLLDSKSQSYFQQLRDCHFPADRNVVPAHISFFHNLPNDERSRIENDLHDVCKQSTLTVPVRKLSLIGNGVMFDVDSSELNALRADLAQRWEQWLIPQDRQKFKPHVVVQNKVSAEKARETLALLSSEFEPFTATAIGLNLWTYLGGPWRLEKEFLFQSL